MQKNFCIFLSISAGRGLLSFSYITGYKYLSHFDPAYQAISQLTPSGPILIVFPHSMLNKTDKWTNIVKA